MTLEWQSSSKLQQSLFDCAGFHSICSTHQSRVVNIVSSISCVLVMIVIVADVILCCKTVIIQIRSD